MTNHQPSPRVLQFPRPHAPAIRLSLESDDPTFALRHRVDREYGARLSVVYNGTRLELALFLGCRVRDEAAVNEEKFATEWTGQAS